MPFLTILTSQARARGGNQTSTPVLYTPRKIDMEPENTPLEKLNHLPNHHFQVLC